MYCGDVRLSTKMRNNLAKHQRHHTYDVFLLKLNVPQDFLNGTTLNNCYLIVSCLIKHIEHLLYTIYAIKTVIPYKIYSNKSLNNISRFWLYIAYKTWLCLGILNSANFFFFEAWPKGCYRIIVSAAPELKGT